MINDVKLEIGRVLIIHRLETNLNHVDKWNQIKGIRNLILVARAKYDAVILQESVFPKMRRGLPLPLRKVIEQSGFIPVNPVENEESEFGDSYWLLEFDPITKKVKKRK